MRDGKKRMKREGARLAKRLFFKKNGREALGFLPAVQHLNLIKIGGTE
jgi:hypothetical protein